MEPTASRPQPAPEPDPAVQKVKDAHGLLTRLREEMDRHPDLEQAIEKLEEALSILTVKTGGML